MAAVVKALWGPHPAFLRLKPRKTLPALIGHFPKHGAGTKVTLREWFNNGLHEHYYTISSVTAPSIDPSTWEFKGFKTISGVQQSEDKVILEANHALWHLYQPPAFTQSIEKKLGLTMETMRTSEKATDEKKQ